MAKAIATALFASFFVSLILYSITYVILSKKMKTKALAIKYSAGVSIVIPSFLIILSTKYSQLGLMDVAPSIITFIIWAGVFAFINTKITK